MNGYRKKPLGPCGLSGFFLIIRYFLFWSFHPQNTIFMMITISTTTAMDTQKPHIKPTQCDVQTF